VLPYFPFDRDTFALTMGIRALGAAPLLEVDPARYRTEVAERAALLEGAPGAYFRELPGTRAAQWEAVRLLLGDLARHHPADFSLREEAGQGSAGVLHWENRLLGTRARLVPDAPAHPGPEGAGGSGDGDGLGGLAPLDWLGRQVQEDLLLLDGTTAGWPLVAGSLCFASGWSLEEKVGLPLLAVHAPVPGYAQALGRSTDLLMERLEAGRPVTRVNWGLAVTDALNLAPWTEPTWRHLREGITADNAGERVFLRLERQVVSRLPVSRGLLFTLHIWRAPVAGEVEDPERRRRLAAVLRTTPEDTRRYKRIDALAAPLLAWLEARG
jgi:hypothetical protein